MKRCPAPCSGKIAPEDYQKSIEQITRFLEGKQDSVVRQLRREIESAAARLEFEQAAMLRDRVRDIEQVISAQRIAVKARGELDAVAQIRNDNESFVMVFFIRGGKLVGREHFILKGTAGENPGAVLGSFVSQYYSAATHIPPLVLLESPPDDQQMLEAWLTERRDGRVRINVPRRGARLELMNMVRDNARRGLEQYRLKKLLTGAEDHRSALEELAKVLKLKSPPGRIEGYDISNIQGTLAVGSMVVFHQGRPDSKHYRRFRIRTVAGADDFAMMKEVIDRRFRRPTDQAGDDWAKLPDLVLIDGGKGQLSAAMAALRERQYEHIPVIGLAKEREEIFIPGLSRPIVLDERSPARRLLQRIRDEAHRFALGYHGALRRKSATGSLLDAVPGIGPAKRRALIRQFGSVAGVRTASAEELATVKGITPRLARLVKESL
jgi:excinuclease ABC subunit C